MRADVAPPRLQLLNTSKSERGAIAEMQHEAIPAVLLSRDVRGATGFLARMVGTGHGRRRSTLATPLRTFAAV
jgi:hypothetical protein